MKTNSLAFKRDMMWKKALRKRRLERGFWRYADEHPYYDNLHQYSKNKIHCSCPICSAKTRNKGKRRYRKGNYSRALNYKVSDLRKQMAMDFDEFDTLGIQMPARDYQNAD